MLAIKGTLFPQLVYDIANKIQSAEPSLDVNIQNYKPGDDHTFMINCIKTVDIKKLIDDECSINPDKVKNLENRHALEELITQISIGVNHDLKRKFSTLKHRPDFSLKTLMLMEGESKLENKQIEEATELYLEMMLEQLKDFSLMVGFKARIDVDIHNCPSLTLTRFSYLVSNESNQKVLKHSQIVNRPAESTIKDFNSFLQSFFSETILL